MECKESSDNEARKTEVNDGSASNSNKGTIIYDVELEISIHALCCSPKPKTIKFIRNICGKARVILVDTGSTYNFIDPSIIQGARLCSNPT